ncbi:MAG: hypothetical protein KY469_11170 [Actinobacteria bacterium]|nr:hypothetical protein [Actinomycetota bacterium]
MAVSLLHRIASSARVPVCIVTGRGEEPVALRLGIDPRIEVVDSPRHATVLVVIGAIAADHAPALRRVHDQLPHPRAAVWWTAERLTVTTRDVLPDVEEVRVEPLVTITDLHRALLLGDRSSAPAVGPADNPTSWKGVGPHGQGGEGMMGGVPYGRGMAMTGEDVRDGLELDRVPLTLGPFHRALPSGLTLELELQGDVIVACDARGPNGPWLGSATGADGDVPDARLVAVAHLLRVHGLDALAQRVVRTTVDGPEAAIAPLLRSARRRLRPALQGVGVIEGADALDRFDELIADASLPDLALDELGEHLVGLGWSEAVTTVSTSLGTIHDPAEVSG